jgi:hypothetical protein
LLLVFKYLLVDEHWTHVGAFESDRPEWFVGMEFTLATGDYAIVGIVPNADPEGEYTATWTVERA